MKSRSKNFSKILCVITLILLIGTLIIAIISNFTNYQTDIYTILIPSCAGLASSSVIFYYTKAKAENLSKQRVRYVLMKLLLEQKLSSEAYQEICYEIDHIDEVLNSKLDQQLVEAINTDTSI